MENLQHVILTRVGHRFSAIINYEGLSRPKRVFSIEKIKILRVKQAHRSASSSRQRIDHPHPEGLTTRLAPVE